MRTEEGECLNMTAPRNPSELARLEQELTFFLAKAYDLRFPKSYREEQLREARKIERILGVEGENYNKR